MAASYSRPFTLVIADDNADVAESLALCLKESGFGVTVVYDGMEAVWATYQHS